MSTNRLPPLPPPYEKEVFATAANTESVRQGYEMGGYVKHPPLYTADQMREYARAAVELEREVCAKVCDSLHWPWHIGDDSGPKECAEAIRARGNQ